MDTSTLENWLWDAACSIRGPLDAPKFKDYILPLLFFKRLSDVYDDELAKLAAELGGLETARQLAHADRKLIRFYIPPQHSWADVRADANQLGKRLTDTMKAIAHENPKNWPASLTAAISTSPKPASACSTTACWPA